MEENIAQANMDAAHNLEERFHRTWDQLWDDAGIFVNSAKGWAWQFYQTITRERPFSCVRCGRGISYSSLIYTDVPVDQNALRSVVCYPCVQLAAAKLSFFGAKSQEATA